MKTIYCLKTRMSDSDEWSETEYFRTRKERDKSGSMARIIGGIRTHSFEEKMSSDDVEHLLD